MILTRAETRHVVDRIFADTSGVLIADLDDNAMQSEVPGWDSFAHVELVLSIEDEFSIEFTTQEIPVLNRIGAIVDAIAVKKGWKA